VSSTSPVARLASRVAALKSRRPGEKTVTTVKTVTTAMTGTTVAGLRTGVAVVGVTAGNLLWMVIGDAQNAAVTISPGGWSALTVKPRNEAEPRIDSGALHLETGTKIAEGETATATTSEPAPGHATGKEGTTGGTPGVAMTGEVGGVVVVEGAEVALNLDQGTGSVMNAILITSRGERNASSAGRLNLAAGITADPLEVLQWTEGVEEAGDSIAEMGTGTALSARHTISLRG